MLSTDNDIAKIIDHKNMRDFASKQILKSLSKKIVYKHYACNCNTWYFKK